MLSLPPSLSPSPFLFSSSPRFVHISVVRSHVCAQASIMPNDMHVRMRPQRPITCMCTQRACLSRAYVMGCPRAPGPRAGAVAATNDEPSKRRGLGRREQLSRAVQRYRRTVQWYRSRAPQRYLQGSPNGVRARAAGRTCGARAARTFMTAAAAGGGSCVESVLASKVKKEVKSRLSSPKGTIL